MVRVYALVEGNLILYVGKTIRDLKRRARFHRAKYDQTHSRYIPEHCEWEMVEIGEYPDDEGTLWEQFWYDTLDPLYNSQRPGQTSAEYMQTEKVKKSQAEASRRYRLKMKELKEQQLAE